MKKKVNVFVGLYSDMFEPGIVLRGPCSTEAS